ncbi:44333_t:CDS:2, partial [Gigaspora margarita]
DQYKLKRKQQKVKQRACASYRQHEREQRCKRNEDQRTKRQKICIKKDIQAIEACVPLLLQYPTEKLVDMTFSKDPNTDSDEDEENENDNNYKFNDDERFTILNSNNRINAVNLRIDYMYCSEQLKNICLYDYIATIHKIKINKKELDKLNRQKLREGHATKVDRFLFKDGEKE